MQIINQGFIFFRLSSLEKKVGRYKKFEEYLLRVIDVMPEGMSQLYKSKTFENIMLLRQNMFEPKMVNFAQITIKSFVVVFMLWFYLEAYNWLCMLWNLLIFYNKMTNSPWIASLSFI